MTAPLGVASIREVDVVGVFRYRNTYPTCIVSIDHKGMDMLLL